jgi:hypothetical protein
MGEIIELVESGAICEYTGAITAYATKLSDVSGDKKEIHGTFIAPYARGLICLDSGYLSDNYSGVLLTATTLDPAEEICVLAFGIVYTESKEWWSWWLRWFFKVFNMQNLHVAFISNRAKGLKPALDKIKPSNVEVWHYHYTQHLKENVATVYGKEIAKLFSITCTIKTIADFNKYLDKIQVKNPAAAEYIRNIPVKQYAFYAAPLNSFPRFFYTISNLVELSNNTFKPACQLPWLLAIDWIWQHI